MEEMKTPSSTMQTENSGVFEFLTTKAELGALQDLSESIARTTLEDLEADAILLQDERSVEGESKEQEESGGLKYVESSYSMEPAKQEAISAKSESGDVSQERPAQTTEVAESSEQFEPQGMEKIVFGPQPYQFVGD